MAKETYAGDVAFLSKHTKVVELAGPGDARVAIVPEFQGRVMTSSLAGEKGAGFGWINKGFIEAGQPSEAFNNYGGEDRFWLGPEGGQFALFFKNGQPFDLSVWQTPKGFNTGKFRVTSQGKGSVAMVANFDVTNYSGTKFQCAVRRSIRTLTADDAASHLGAAVPEGVKMVGYSSANTLVNAGKKAWTREAGLLSIWILGQYKPLPNGKVIAPFNQGDDAKLGPKVMTDYFCKLPAARGKFVDGAMLFSCDGKFRSKIGVSPLRAKPVIGSYDPDAKVLTVVNFNLPVGAHKLPWVNSLWETQKQPYAGDVINSYNDSGSAPGVSFYELETSSPAAELKAGGAITHIHRTYHFSGAEKALNEIAVRALGVELSQVR